MSSGKINKKSLTEKEVDEIKRKNKEAMASLSLSPDNRKEPLTFAKPSAKSSKHFDE